ncbi:RagB/SusD family nutrient uptake outer membrane protein [Robertkochia flava]|uniref:RagB/SusD family nutrient uptake outer membrane protein n=1 Tax=Robertkochia flava TaxID=3447986 RepID=UPI001CC98D69|nr:RagB/SusD family nutrient uptake outer membrane protein [Robertkochia marina]
MNNIYKIALVGLLTISGACTTGDLEPSTEQNKPVEGGIATVGNLEGVLKGAYSRMTGSGYYGRDYIVTNEVRTDNCFSNGNSGRFTTQASFTYDANTGYFWDDAYRVIASANIIIGQDISVLTGDLDYAAHLQGQAYAMRALAHFDLVKQYGQQHAGGTLGVPYVTEFKGDDLFPARNTVEENKANIYADLEMAFQLMQDAYFDDSREFMSKYSAKALESRVAVYFEDWNRAVSASEAVINSGLYSILPANSYVSSWSSTGNANSIFELAFNPADNLGSNSLGFIYKTGIDANGDPIGSYGDVQVIDEVIDIFDDADVRKDILGYEGTLLRNLGKYPNLQGFDNVVLIRYEEVILNYAEALFETGGDALTEINKIATNRGLPAYASVTKDIILDERRKELMFEGFRFDDLMRTGMDIEKYSLQQNFAATIPYGDFRLAFPVPTAELNANSNMVQNDGY